MQKSQSSAILNSNDLFNRQSRQQDTHFELYNAQDVAQNTIALTFINWRMGLFREAIKCLQEEACGGDHLKGHAIQQEDLTVCNKTKARGRRFANLLAESS